MLLFSRPGRQIIPLIIKTEMLELNPLKGYAVGNSGKIIKTIDGGTTWLHSTSGTIVGLESVYFTDENTGYVAGGNGTILKTTNGGGVFIKETNSGNPSFTIYPNPTTGYITVETSAIPTQSQLSISNLNGEELITRPITEPKTQLDISSLPQGVYFVHLIIDQSVQAGKVIKQ